MKEHFSKAVAAQTLLSALLLLAFLALTAPGGLFAQDKGTPSSSRMGALPPPPPVQSFEPAGIQPSQTQAQSESPAARGNADVPAVSQPATAASQAPADASGQQQAATSAPEQSASVPQAPAAPEQTAAAPQVTPANPQPPVASQAPAIPESPAAAPQGGTASVQNPFGITCPPEYVPLIQKTTTALMSENFNFYPIKGLDPFVPFVSLEVTSHVRVGASSSSS